MSGTEGIISFDFLTVSSIFLILKAKKWNMQNKQKSRADKKTVF